MKFPTGWLVAFLAWAGCVQAAEVSVAVAANFTAPMQKIASAFMLDTGHKATLSFGSTGKFYAQIKNGAPFQVLLAADDETPARLEKEGVTVNGTRFPYAIGKLVLWSKQPGLVDDRGAVLKSARFDHIALADPKLAPYGVAAIEVMDHLGLQTALRPKLVQCENIGQAFQFVVSESVPLGFVALSQVWADGKLSQGSVWLIPEQLYAPLRQDAVLLASARDHPAAVALMAYLRGPKARAIIQSFGYEFPNTGAL